VTSRSRVAALGKGTTIPGALRLAAKYHGDAETDNISWTEYQIKITGVSPKPIFLAYISGVMIQTLFLHCKLRLSLTF